MQIINCVDACLNEPIIATVSGANPVGFGLAYFLVCADVVEETTVDGTFSDPATLGLTPASDCSVYAVNYETGTTLPVATDTYSNFDWQGACYSEVSLPVCINPLFEVCQAQGTINSTISGANTTAPYVLDYFLVCGGTVQEKNTDGIFDFSAAPINDVAAGSCTIYAVNHDGSFTQAQDVAWAAPTAGSCATVKEACVIVNPLPVANAVELALCDDGDGTVDFTLTDAEDATTASNVAGSATDVDNGALAGTVTVTYYDLQLCADDSTGVGCVALTSPHPATDGTIVYARVTNNSTGCYETAEVTLTVNPLPVAPVIPAITVCAGGSTNIVPTPPVVTTPVTFTWNFEAGITGMGVSDDATIAADAATQTAGSGLGGVAAVGAGSGCSAAVTSNAYNFNPNRSLATAVADNEYFEFCVGAGANGNIFQNVSDIAWNHRASGNGPKNWALTTAADPSTALLTGTTSGSCAAAGGAVASTATCYRIYYWEAIGAAGTLRIADMVVTANYSTEIGRASCRERV